MPQPARCFMPKIVIYQTTPVWFVKNEYLIISKIDVYCSLLPSDHVIGWDMKMTSHPNSNASFVNIWDHLIWRWSPNLTRSSKLAAAPNCLWPSLAFRITSRLSCGGSKVWPGKLLQATVLGQEIIWTHDPADSSSTLGPEARSVAPKKARYLAFLRSETNRC